MMCHIFISKILSPFDVMGMCFFLLFDKKKMFQNGETALTLAAEFGNSDVVNRLTAGLAETQIREGFKLAYNNFPVDLTELVVEFA